MSASGGRVRKENKRERERVYIEVRWLFCNEV